MALGATTTLQPDPHLDLPFLIPLMYPTLTSTFADWRPDLPRGTDGVGCRAVAVACRGPCGQAAGAGIAAAGVGIVWVG